ncbi:MAG TPA: cell surface protein, partial [Rudaea sp.]|nr:cell surface protein [Rudaea sp.]
MHGKHLVAAFIAAIGTLVVTIQPARAVYLNPRGMGQVLLYPYYTVNAHQNTLLSVINASDVGKVVHVRFREGYNGRDVLDFNVFLSPYDVWTAAVF